MSDDIKRLEAKVDRILEDIPEIKADLRDHMRRTEISEEKHEKQTEINQALITRLEPLEKSNYVWGIIGKAMLAIATGAVIAFLSVWLRTVFHAS